VSFRIDTGSTSFSYGLPTIERHLDRAKQIKDNLDHNNRNTRGTTGTNDTKAKGASKY
jgi:hypothetical protein